MTRYGLGSTRKLNCFVRQVLSPVLPPCPLSLTASLNILLFMLQNVDRITDRMFKVAVKQTGRAVLVLDPSAFAFPDFVILNRAVLTLRFNRGGFLLH